MRVYDFQSNKQTAPWHLQLWSQPLHRTGGQNIHHNLTLLALMGKWMWFHRVWLHLSLLLEISPICSPLVLLALYRIWSQVWQRKSTTLLLKMGEPRLGSMQEGIEKTNKQTTFYFHSIVVWFFFWCKIKSSRWWLKSVAKGHYNKMDSE